MNDNDEETNFFELAQRLIHLIGQQFTLYITSLDCDSDDNKKLKKMNKNNNEKNHKIKIIIN